jgi:hypothetical protein
MMGASSISRALARCLAYPPPRPAEAASEGSAVIWRCTWLTRNHKQPPEAGVRRCGVGRSDGVKTGSPPLLPSLRLVPAP